MQAAGKAGSKGKLLTQADKDALARREAAKARVQKRELQDWGML